MNVRRTQWKGEDAVVLTDTEYEAVVLPDYGANCISLIHRPTGDELLRVPGCVEELKAASNVYGLPLLFPPNRIRDGMFVFQGRRYQFPLNEPERGNHIHGMLYQSRFTWDGMDGFTYEANAGNPYLSFPHAFLMKRKYTMTREGLNVIVQVTNRSSETMPCGLGIHAALRLPSEEACFLTIPAEKQWLVDPVRLLPTGETVDDSPLLQMLRTGEWNPDAEPVSALLECGQGSVIRLKKPGGTWECTLDRHFRFVMLWNGGGQRHFVCPEPQTWVTDAPNLPLDQDATGIEWIEPGGTLQTVLRYSCQPGGQSVP